MKRRKCFFFVFFIQQILRYLESCQKVFGASTPQGDFVIEGGFCSGKFPHGVQTLVVVMAGNESSETGRLMKLMNPMKLQRLGPVTGVFQGQPKPEGRDVIGLTETAAR